MTKNTISVSYNLKWQLNFDNKYQWSECGKLFNIKTGREIKKVVNGYSVGYWIGKKFFTLNNLRNYLEEINDIDCPF